LHTTAGHRCQSADFYTLFYLIGASAAAGLLVYLVVALLKAENL
jgi:K+-transporting ATPase KdpF subunit